MAQICRTLNCSCFCSSLLCDPEELRFRDRLRARPAGGRLWLRPFGALKRMFFYSFFLREAWWLNVYPSRAPLGWSSKWDEAATRQFTLERTRYSPYMDMRLSVVMNQYESTRKKSGVRRRRINVAGNHHHLHNGGYPSWSRWNGRLGKPKMVGSSTASLESSLFSLFKKNLTIKGWVKRETFSLTTRKWLRRDYLTRIDWREREGTRAVISPARVRLYSKGERFFKHVPRGLENSCRVCDIQTGKINHWENCLIAMFARHRNATVCLSGWSAHRHFIRPAFFLRILLYRCVITVRNLGTKRPSRSIKWPKRLSISYDD